MTRFTDKEKVMVGRARTQATIATQTDIDTVAGAVGVLFDLVSRPFRQGAIARNLRQLDDRMLADIGLRRWNIDEVAKSAVAGRKTTFGAAFIALFGAIGRAIAIWRRRRIAYRELMALDDRMLQDVGLSRGNIPAVIAAIGRVEADADFTSIDALRAWNRGRDVLKTLGALDNHMLDDLGMVRGDIEIVAEAMALRSLRPANRDGRVPQAA